MLGVARSEGLLPDFPFGTELTPTEIRLAHALKGLKAIAHSRPRLLRAAATAAVGRRQRPTSVTACNGSTSSSLKASLIESCAGQSFGPSAPTGATPRSEHWASMIGSTVETLRGAQGFIGPDGWAGGDLRNQHLPELVQTSLIHLKPAEDTDG